QDTYRVCSWAGHGKVEMAVAVEVSHRQGAGSVADVVVLGGPKGAVALAQQDSHRNASCHLSEVEMAVAVKVPHRQGGSTDASGVALGGLEGAVAPAQQDR